MAVASRIQVEVFVVAGELAAHQFNAANLDDAVAVFSGEASGFGVQNNLSHAQLSSTVLISEPLLRG